MDTIKLINYLSQHKRRISRGLYLLAALVEQLPDPDILVGRDRRARRDLPKLDAGRSFTIADQLKPKSKPRKRNGRNRKSK